jgi:hypothetical protein
VLGERGSLPGVKLVLARQEILHGPGAIDSRNIRQRLQETMNNSAVPPGLPTCLNRRCP